MALDHQPYRGARRHPLDVRPDPREVRRRGRDVAAAVRHRVPVDPQDVRDPGAPRVLARPEVRHVAEERDHRMVGIGGLERPVERAHLGERHPVPRRLLDREVAVERGVPPHPGDPLRDPRRIDDPGRVVDRVGEVEDDLLAGRLRGVEVLHRVHRRAERLDEELRPRGPDRPDVADRYLPRRERDRRRIRRRDDGRCRASRGERDGAPDDGGERGKRGETAHGPVHGPIVGRPRPQRHGPSVLSRVAGGPRGDGAVVAAGDVPGR